MSGMSRGGVPETTVCETHSDTAVGKYLKCFQLCKGVDVAESSLSGDVRNAVTSHTIAVLGIFELVGNSVGIGARIEKGYLSTMVEIRRSSFLLALSLLSLITVGCAGRTDTESEGTVTVTPLATLESVADGTEVATSEPTATSRAQPVGAYPTAASTIPPAVATLIVETCYSDEAAPTPTFTPRQVGGRPSQEQLDCERTVIDDHR